MTIAIHQIETAVCVSTKLLGFYNANTGGAQVKKFADRATAERRCIKLAQELDAEGVLSSELFIAISQGTAVEQHPDYAAAVAHPDNIAAAEREIATRALEGEDMSTATVDPVTSAIVKAQPPAPIDYIRTEASDLLVKQLAHAVHHAGDCPSCGGTQDITSGRIVERAGHQHIVDEGYFMCHSCGHEWGTKDNHYVRPNGKPITSRPAMAASLKLDRQIVSVASGIIYKNACQVWKAGLVSSSQCDRLSAVLYGAAKAGNRHMSVTVNGHVFALAVK